MASEKVVTPVKTGVQKPCNRLKLLNTGFRQDDEKKKIRTFYEIIRE
jgi:hypothetical protein